MERWTVFAQGRFGADMALAEAIEARDRSRGVAQPVPARYRRPRITRDEALEVGLPEIERLKGQVTGDLTWLEPFVYDRPPMHWVVGCPPQEWQDEGKIPGAVIVWVDRVDGHIWTDAEMEEYALITEQTRFERSWKPG